MCWICWLNSCKFSSDQVRLEQIWSDDGSVTLWLGPSTETVQRYSCNMLVHYSDYIFDKSSYNLCLPAAQPYPKLYIFRLGRYGGAFSYVVMASELVTIAFLIYFTVVETRKITKSGKQYFKVYRCCKINGLFIYVPFTSMYNGQIIWHW